MSFLLNPYNFLVAGGDFESISSATVGAGGSSSIDFTSIPQTYQHLQVRGRGILNRTAPYDGPLYLSVRINGNTSNVYTTHYLGGSGSGGIATTYNINNSSFLPVGRSASSDDNLPFFFIIDFFDYTSTTKKHAPRMVAGYDPNGAGAGLWINSGFYQGTGTITSISLLCNVNVGGTLRQNTTAALYGINAP